MSLGEIAGWLLREATLSVKPVDFVGLHSVRRPQTPSRLTWLLQWVVFAGREDGSL